MCKFKRILRQAFFNYFSLSIILIIGAIAAIQYFFPKTDILNLTIWGPFFGAGFAFILNYLHEKQRIKQENRQTLIKEHVKLQALYNELKQALKHIEECKKRALEKKEKYHISDEKWEFFEWQFITPYFSSKFSSSPYFSKKPLDFMLETGGFECLKAILLANEQYEKSFYFLQKRNELYESYLTKSESLDEKKLFDCQILIKQVGEKLLGQNFNTTKALLENLKNSAEDIHTAFIKTGDFIRATFNKEPLYLNMKNN